MREMGISEDTLEVSAEQLGNRLRFHIRCQFIFSISNKRNYNLQVGIEQAREWFASDVLQPLMVAISSAHVEVIAGAAQLGFPGVRLTPLTDLGKH